MTAKQRPVFRVTPFPLWKHGLPPAGATVPSTLRGKHHASVAAERKLAHELLLDDSFESGDYIYKEKQFARIQSKRAFEPLDSDSTADATLVDGLRSILLVLAGLWLIWQALNGDAQRYSAILLAIVCLLPGFYRLPSTTVKPILRRPRAYFFRPVDEMRHWLCRTLVRVAEAQFLLDKWGSDAYRGAIGLCNSLRTRLTAVSRKYSPWKI